MQFFLLQVFFSILKNYCRLEKKSYYPFIYVVCNCLFKGTWSSSRMVDIQLFFFLDWLLFKDLKTFVVGWHVLERNSNIKERWLLTINNKWMLQQMKRKVKWNKQLSSILLLLIVTHQLIFILESKFVVMDDMFHMIRFKRM